MIMAKPVIVTHHGHVSQVSYTRHIPVCWLSVALTVNPHIHYAKQLGRGQSAAITQLKEQV